MTKLRCLRKWEVSVSLVPSLHEAEEDYRNRRLIPLSVSGALELVMRLAYKLHIFSEVSVSRRWHCSMSEATYASSLTLQTRQLANLKADWVEVSLWVPPRQGV